MGSPLPAGGALSISLATFRPPFLTGRGAPSSLPHDGPPSRTVSPPPTSITWAGFPLLRLRASSHLHPPGSGPGLGGGALREPLPLRRCGGEWRGVGSGGGVRVRGRFEVACRASRKLVPTASVFFCRAFRGVCHTLLFLEGVALSLHAAVLALWFFHLLRN